MKKILLVLFPILLLAFMHPHYLSVTDLKFNEKEKRLEGYVKIVTHDFENTLKKVHKRPIDLINPTDTASTAKLLEHYLFTHITIQADGKKLTYRLIGFEQEQESIYMYIESMPFLKPKKVDFQINLLYETYPQQTNIVHLEVFGVKKSLKVSNPAKDLQFQF